MDTELVYAYAKTGDLGALEEFISGAQQANLQARARRARPSMRLAWVGVLACGHGRSLPVPACLTSDLQDRLSATSNRVENSSGFW